MALKLRVSEGDGSGIRENSDVFKLVSQRNSCEFRYGIQPEGD